MDAPREESGSLAAERRGKILKEAANIFYDKGFEGACIDDLIARIGGSKRTIYNEFGNKEGLFKALIADLVSKHGMRLIAGLDADEKSGASIEQVLMDFACQLMRIVMDPEVLAFQRIIIAEGKRFPSLAKAFYDSGPARSCGRLAEILERHRQQGEIQLSDCRMAAEQFSGMIRDAHYTGVLLGLIEPPNPAEMEHRAKMAVGIFLSGIRKKR